MRNTRAAAGRTAVHVWTALSNQTVRTHRDTYTHACTGISARERLIHAVRKSEFQKVLSLASAGLPCWKNYLLSRDRILTNPVARILVCGI